MQFQIFDWEKDKKLMKKRTIAIVLAAGQGKRMNSAVRKQYLLIQEKPILYYTLKTFEDSFIDEIILVVGEGEENYCRKNIVDKYMFSKVSAIVVGGKERYHSVYQALLRIAEEQKTDSYVFIHDGARPFVTNKVLKDAYETVCECEACIVAVPVKDTIKVVTDDKIVHHTPARSTLWTVQTPQVFSYDKVKNAYDKMLTLEEQGKLQMAITDDAMVMESFSDIPIKVVEGNYENIKITTPEDLIFAERILNDT